MGRVALCHSFDLKVNRIHLGQVLGWLFMDKTSSMYLYVKLNRDADCFIPVESKEGINSASYELRVVHVYDRVSVVIKDAGVQRFHNVVQV